MVKRSLLAGFSLMMCLGVTCNISIPGQTTTVTLDEADAVIRISRLATALEADVVADITDSTGTTVELEDNQSVAVNDEELVGPSALGEYSRTITADTTYTVKVTEPTRGVEETSISEPSAFDITAPVTAATVSLSGFTMTWTNPDASLQVRVTLTQTIFGSQRTQTFGPFADTGTLTLDADDLSQFGQGANLQITLTKLNERVGVNGFNVATLSSALAQVVVATPGP